MIGTLVREHDDMRGAGGAVGLRRRPIRDVLPPYRPEGHDVPGSGPLAGGRQENEVPERREQGSVRRSHIPVAAEHRSIPAPIAHPHHGLFSHSPIADPAFGQGVRQVGAVSTAAHQHCLQSAVEDRRVHDVVLGPVGECGGERDDRVSAAGPGLHRAQALQGGAVGHAALGQVPVDLLRGPGGGRLVAP